MPRSPASSAIRVARCGRSQLAQAQLMLPQHRHLPDADDAHCVAGNHHCGDLLVEGRNATEPHRFAFGWRFVECRSARDQALRNHAFSGGDNRLFGLPGCPAEHAEGFVAGHPSDVVEVGD